MSQNLDSTDKIVLNPTDSADITEMFSRLNPGDEVSGKFKATLDEAGQKTVVLSISEIEFDKNEEGEKAEGEEDDEEGEGDEGENDSAAVKMMKSQEEGVPAGEDNTPAEVMPTH
jgi:hypothetical protein